MSPARCCSCGLRQRQLDVIQNVLSRHFPDQLRFQDFRSGTTFTSTVCDRDIQSYVHNNHLAAALDIVNTYQRERRSRPCPCKVMSCVGCKRHFDDDPRTRVLEILKEWLRENVSKADVSDEEVQRFGSLCHDLLLEQALFPARNRRNFIQTLAEVYEQCEEHRKLQLEEALRRDRSCAELLNTVRTLSANLLSDAIGFLLVGLTDLTQTDQLPSVEAVALWRSLPLEWHPLPGSMDPRLQRSMHGAWRTCCGRTVAALLSSPWFVRLLDCRDERPTSRSLEEILAGVDQELNVKGRFRDSGFAGVFRSPVHEAARDRYFHVCRFVDIIAYLNGQVLMLFHHISVGLGDYGMISLARWLHPLLDELKERVQHLQSGLEQLNRVLEQALVLPRARGAAVPRPTPTDHMHRRAAYAVKRATQGPESHSQKLLRKLEELKMRSATERLQGLRESVTDAYVQIHGVLTSSDFRSRVRIEFPETPALENGTSLSSASASAPSNSLRGMLSVTNNPETILSKLSVSVSSEVEQSGRITYYRVDVASKGSTEMWPVMRRFSEFRELAERFAGSLRKFRHLCKRNEPIFPTRLVTKCGGSAERRRRHLDAWLQDAMRVAMDFESAWLSPLFDFLEVPGASTLALRGVGNGQPGHLHAIANDPSHLLPPRVPSEDRLKQTNSLPPRVPSEDRLKQANSLPNNPSHLLPPSEECLLDTSQQSLGNQSCPP